MSSTPSSSLSNEARSPPYHAENTGGVPPYVSRSAPIQTLPPPQNATANPNATPQLYSHALAYPGSSGLTSGLNSGIVSGQNKGSLRYGYIGDTFNYSSLGQPQPQSSKFQQLAQVPVHHLPQNGFPLSSQFPNLQDKVAQPFQSFVAQPQSQYAGPDMEAKHSIPIGGSGLSSGPNNSLSSLHTTSGINSGIHSGLNSANPPNTSSLAAAVSPSAQYAKQMRYSAPDSDKLENPYPHTPKFVHAKASKAPKDPKFTKVKFHTTLTPEPDTSKPYECAYDGCRWSFARQSDLRRHSKSHNAPTFHCPYWKNDPTCHRNGGSFSRLDVLKRHLRLVHYIKDKQKAYGDADPGWCRSCQKMFASSKTFIEHCDECSSQVAPAEWKTNSAMKEPVANE